MERCVVFICFTRSHAIHIRNVLKILKLTNPIIISRIDQLSGFENAHVLDVSGNPVVARIRWNRILKVLSSQVNVELIVPHFLNVFVQDLYWNLVNRDALSSLSIYPDGNLLFHSYLEGGFSRNNLIRKIISIFMIMKFKMVSGRIVSPFQEPDVIFSYLNDVQYPAKELRIIGFQEINTRLKSDQVNLLFLGHRQQGLVPDEDLEKDIRRILLSKQDGSNIYVKPHPRLKDIRNDQYSVILKNMRIPFKLLAEDEPVESIMDVLRVGTVYAVASSALITLKLLNPEVKFYFGQTHKYLSKEQAVKLGRQFNALNITELS